MSQPPKVKVFVEGRYRKLTRDLPQTVFFCPDCKGHIRRRKGCARCEGFGKLTRDSVQELVGWVLAKAFGTRKHKFHGAGREDIDVRMLGEGRPFVVEMIGPKISDVDLAAQEAEINRRNEGRLEIRGLHWTEKTRVRALKEGKHAKEYRALVETGAGAQVGELERMVGERILVAQNTPSRVAHRRADKVRERWIELRAVERVDETHLELRLATEHGTYVKEVVSGEGGSTEPSIAGMLGVETRCVELDVLGVLGEDGEAMDVGVGGTRGARCGEGV
jgi:tRNA pseudouridine synthase 10